VIAEMMARALPQPTEIEIIRHAWSRAWSSAG
jgi:hypothetical protein